MPIIVPTPAPGLGYGGAEYGYSPYGSGGVPRDRHTTTGGYGGAPYGYGSYGSVDVTPPRVTSATSIDGYTIEIFFSEAMRVEAVLLDTGSYTLTPTRGAPSTVLSVEVGTEEDGGASSVILTHTGTTLGGTYVIVVAATLRDVVGNLILGTARTASFMSLGAEPTYAVTAVGGDQIRLDFSENMLPEADFSPGVENLDAYGFETTYPVPIDVVAAVLADVDSVLLTVSGMTSATYVVTVSPATSISYDGSYLPDTATMFAGVSTGTGTSTAGSGLLLTKAVGVSYGWDFQDTSGKMLPASTYRVDVAIDASAAVYVPVLYDAVLGAITVSDGAVQVVVTLARVAGTDVIEVSSGAFFVQVPGVWSAGSITLSLVRNQKADLYALLLDGVPLASGTVADFTGVPSIVPGVRVALGATYAVTQFPVLGVSVTSSQTVFSASWNFLHGVVQSFVGSAALARSSILTRRGPLVKDWGDPTPATAQDVAVRVNGIAVDVSSVNPYLGLVTPAIPIPLTTPGTTSVEVDYIWYPTPVFQMTGLNTPGLVLNKWDLHQGWHPPAESPIPASSLGVPDRQRFPMGIVLSPIVRQRPILIGHRYIGFERAYTAALNSPTTLLLNQNPHRVARDILSASPDNVQVTYEGTLAPPTSTPVWALTGVDSGHVGVGADAGYYVLIDESAGTYAVGEAALYTRDEDFSFPSVVGMAARVWATTWTVDGVFTGLAFGFHNDRYLYLVGLLDISGVRHVGLLRNPLRPDLATSWEIGPSFDLTITSASTFTTSSTLVAPGVVFQILDGSQAGVYEVAACGVDGTTVTITGSFPANPKFYGNKSATAYLNVPWDEAPITLRILSEVGAGSAQVFVGGSLAGLAIATTRVPAYPAQTTLLLPTSRKGAFFWGSASRVAVNESLWGFVRYGITYDQVTFHFSGIVVAAEMSDTPDQDANHEWFVSEDFGYGEIDATGDTLLLKGTSASTTLDTTFGYARLEPFLSGQTLIDVDATFLVDSGSLGAGDAQVRVQNGDRIVLFSTILYTEGVSPFRRLAEIPVASLVAIRDPADDGWSSTIVGPATVTPRESLLVVEQEAGGSARIEQDLVLTVDSGHGRIAEARFAIVASSTLVLGDGPYFGAGVGPSGRDVGLTLLSAPARVQLVSDGVAIGSPVIVSWDDGAQHAYRLLSDPITDSVVLVVDDLVTVTTTLSSFTITGSSTIAYFGVGNSGANPTSMVEWASFSVIPMPIPSLKRTLGVLRNGGDPDDIDGWVLPRTDASNVLNSEIGAVIQDMDWRDTISVRIRLDPGWGCTVFRSDLPPPPYYDGEFATQYTEPSAGWINVEYRHLPRGDTSQRPFGGRVVFGALDPRTITQQRWEEVRYRIYTRGDEDFIAPQHMVLNRYNVITSGEYLHDTGAEVVEVEAMSSTLVSLAPTHIRADRVFNVVYDGVVLNPTDWTFDQDAQVITLLTPLPEAHARVTVTFAPGKPITNTYLCSQPLPQSTTLLNEGTPPVPRSQVGTATREVVFGSALNDPSDLLGSPDFILNDPFRTVAFVDNEDALYEALEFCEVDDGYDTGLIAIACDGPAPEQGWIDITLSGTSFSEGFSREGGPARWGGSNVAADTVGGFSQTSVMHLSGGVYDGGRIGAAILYPSYPAIAGPDRGAIYRSMRMAMRMSSVLTDASSDPVVEVPLIDDANIAGTVSDNVPATYADATEPNPDGTPAPSGNGAAVAVMTDYGSTTFSRIGPWAGWTALAVRSQLAGGGLPASGNPFILVGGAPLGSNPTPVTIPIEAP